MKFIYASVCAASLLLAQASFGAEGAEEIKNAAQKLADKGSYSWTSTSKMEGRNFEPRPLHGKIDKSAAVVTWSGRNDQENKAVIKGDKAFLKTEEGWESVEELTSGEGRNRGAFMARRFQNFKAPAAEAQEIVKHLGQIKKEGDAYTGELTKEGAREIMTRGMRRGGNDNQPVPKGTAKFWVKDGVLSKYEYNIQGKITVGQDNREVDLNTTTTVEIKDVGSTKVELPEGLPTAAK